MLGRRGLVRGSKLPDVEILFRRCKSEAMKRPARSRAVMMWFHQRYPGMDPHHVFGSLGSLKSSDYAIIPVDRPQHNLHQDDRGWLIDQLPLVFRVMFDYIAYLESRLEGSSGQ
jgi:hypothetical protein